MYYPARLGGNNMTKEEKKDELKNRISMALEDPILQQGFEIICRELADLQKEVRELRQDKEDLIFVRNAKADHILELKDQIADLKANCDLAIEGRDIKIKELELELTVEKDQHQEEINLHLHAEDYIESLEQQIEKMKCCGNCKFSNQEGVYTIVCKVGGVDKTDYIEIDDNQVCDKWELREIKENE
jgi:hypothetical protein